MLAERSSRDEAPVRPIHDWQSAERFQPIPPKTSKSDRSPSLIRTNGQVTRRPNLTTALRVFGLGRSFCCEPLGSVEGCRTAIFSTAIASALTG